MPENQRRKPATDVRNRQRRETTKKNTHTQQKKTLFLLRKRWVVGMEIETGTRLSGWTRAPPFGPLLISN